MNLLNSSYTYLFSGLNLGDVFNVVIISHHDIHESFISVFQTVFIAIVLDDMLDKGKFIEGDSGENVMFDLVLHASANVVKEPVVEINVSGGDDLMGEIVVDLVFGSLDVTFTSEFLLSFVFVFSLVTGSDDEGRNSTSNEDTQSPDLPRQEAEVPDPVNSQTDQLFVVSAAISPENRVDLPFNLEDGI